MLQFCNFQSSAFSSRVMFLPVWITMSELLERVCMHQNSDSSTALWAYWIIHFEGKNFEFNFWVCGSNIVLGYKVLWILANVQVHITTTKIRIQNGSLTHNHVLCAIPTLATITTGLFFTIILFCQQYKYMKTYNMLQIGIGFFISLGCLWDSYKQLHVSIISPFMLLSSILPCEPTGLVKPL